MKSGYLLRRETGFNGGSDLIFISMARANIDGILIYMATVDNKLADRDEGISSGLYSMNGWKKCGCCFGWGIFSSGLESWWSQLYQSLSSG